MTRAIPCGRRGPRAAAFGLLILAAGTAAAQAAADQRRTLTAQQIAALGIRVEPAGADRAAPRLRYPAQVVIPVMQQRLVAAPLPALVETLQAAVGDPVRAGQTLAVLRSTSADEWQRDAAQADSQAELARRSLARDEELFAQGLIAQSRLDAARAQARQAQAQQSQRHRALEQVGVAGGSGRIVLRAPIAGVVLEQSAVVGQRLEQAAPLYRIAALNPLWVEMQVPAADAQALALGRGVRVEPGPGRTAAGAKPVEGHLIAIGRSVDAVTQTVLARAEVRAPGDTLRAGQTVVAAVEMPAGAGTVLLPAAAVAEDGGTTVVFVQEAPGTFRRVPVEVARTAQGMAQASGVAAGAQIVVAGTASVKAVFAAPAATAASAASAATR